MANLKSLILIDGHALAYRMFFALERTGMKTSTQQPTWALYGFIRAIIDILKKIKPDAIAVSFDVGRKTFRTEHYEQYKAQREAMPDTMKQQMQAIIDAVKAFNIPVYMLENFEADDIIGTIATKAKSLGYKSFILTGDQDSFQLIDKEGLIKVLIPYKNELIEYDSQKVFNKLGVFPEQIVDYKALRGDTSDNIPGIKGIGEKTAAKLLQEYQTLDNIYQNTDKISAKSLKEKLITGKDMAYKSQFLAQIKKDVDINYNFEDAKLEIPEPQILKEFFQKHEFSGFLKQLDSILELFNGQNIQQPSPHTEIRATKQIIEHAPIAQLSLFSPETTQTCQINNDFNKQIIDSEEKLADLISKIKAKKLFAFVPATTSFDVFNAKVAGMAFAYGDGLTVSDNKLLINEHASNITAAYMPISENGMPITKVLACLKPIFEAHDIYKIIQNAKFSMHILKNYNVNLNGVVFDTMVADYVKDSGLKHALKQQSLSYLHFDMQDFEQLLGKGKSALSIENIELNKLQDYFCNDAFAVYKLACYHQSYFSPKEENVFYNIEMPLMEVLFNMERNGVSVDTVYLKNLSEKLSKEIFEIEDEIFEIAGEKFNTNSPKQVGEILFNKLELKPKGKNKTKTGFSTSAEVLESLATEHKIAQLLLEDRHLTKIKNTYIDALPELIEKDKRIHTTFNQTITTTGRLSSSNPNLQNIPTRTPVGNNIRGAFVAQNPQDYCILAADYSQIELRLLAHYSQDEVLINAFKNDIDIHAITAAKIFGVEENEVTKEMRRKAKGVNFGIVYGQSKYGLAEALSISTDEAQEFIDKYFETYPKIKQYMEGTKIFATQNNYVETLYGRKRYFNNDLNSSNRNIREFAQRAAINAPLQGTAADLIKIAMIELDKELKKRNLDAKIILQVHDELVLEVAKKDIEKVSALTQKAMELSQPLDVPLSVELNYGKSWKEAKEAPQTEGVV